jgi:NAD(P)-dependent dehydrogenase (short-subunit alcohol dehydrogenase family)
MNRVAIITGASRGIGKSASYLFAKKGFNLVITARNQLALEEIKKDISNLYSVRVELISGDITKDETRQNIVNHSICTFGRIDVLVNNAGGNFYHGEVSNIKEKHIHRIFDLNYISVLQMSLLCLRQMEKDKTGCIVNISSVTSFAPGKKDIVYGCSKAAIETLTKGLAQCYGTIGIRVNCIRAGYTRTDLLEELTETEILDKTRLTSLGRLAQEQEIAEGILFLGTEVSSYCNGTILDINGGFAISF